MKRNHTLIFTSKGTPGGTDPITGYPLPDVPGAVVNVPCRFHQTNTKVLKNEDSTESQQIGRIRVNIGETMPTQYQNIRVIEGDLVHFEGVAKYIDKTGALLSWRIDV